MQPWPPSELKLALLKVLPEWSAISLLATRGIDPPNWSE